MWVNVIVSSSRQGYASAEEHDSTQPCRPAKSLVRVGHQTEPVPTLLTCQVLLTSNGEPARGGAGGVFMPIARRSAEEYPGSTRGAHRCSPWVSTRVFWRTP